jgi:hypothetical protein
VVLEKKERKPLRPVIGLNAQYGATIQVDLKKFLRCNVLVLDAILRSTLISIIAITLIGFILFKGAVSLLCEPQQANSVALVMSNIVPEGGAIKESGNLDPFSWEPVLHRLVSFFSKACPR